jgi:hypothetical protein
MRDKISARESERTREREIERERETHTEQQPPTTLFYKLVQYGFMYYHNAARACRIWIVRKSKMHQFCEILHFAFCILETKLYQDKNLCGDPGRFLNTITVEKK